MASNSTFQVAFKITDENGMKKLIVDAKDLTGVFGKAAEEAQNLQARAINFAAFATGIDSVNSMLSSLQGVLKELTNAGYIMNKAAMLAMAAAQKTVAATTAA